MKIKAKPTMIPVFPDRELAESIIVP